MRKSIKEIQTGEMVYVRNYEYSFMHHDSWHECNWDFHVDATIIKSIVFTDNKKDKFYDTLKNLSVFVHQIFKIIIKWVIFLEKNYFLSLIIIITKSYLPKT